MQKDIGNHAVSCPLALKNRTLGGMCRFFGGGRDEGCIQHQELEFSSLYVFLYAVPTLFCEDNCHLAASLLRNVENLCLYFSVSGLVFLYAEN